MIKNLILSILEENGKLSAAEVAVLAGVTAEEAAKIINELEEEKAIVGYAALVDWDKTSKESVHALIEIKVAPQKGMGFDKVAKKICEHREVKNLYLMSGGFDLAVMIEGKTMREVAMFVSERLATMDGVTATATHFVLKKYKDKGVTFDGVSADERGYMGV